VIDITESEARALLANPLYCEDCPDWTPRQQLKGSLETTCGLLDKDGISVRMLLELSFRRSAKTNNVRYLFSVFKRLPRGLERVYQLDVSQWNKPIFDKHNQSHEHIGATRIPGKSSWQQLTETLGLSCYPLSNDGSLAMLATPFKFDDRDDIPVFVEKSSGKIRFLMMAEYSCTL
jgi:hypothetical protein